VGPAYSDRLQWSIAANALAIAVERRSVAGQPILDLTQSNPTHAGIRYPRFIDALADEGALSYDPSSQGLLSAREDVSDYYRGSVNPDCILLTASTSEAYSYLFKLLCNPGDEILVPRPSYPLFEMLAHLECVRVAQYPLRYHDGWFIDIHALRDAITTRTRAIVWVNPNNPTGSYLKSFEFQEIAALCNLHGLVLISDEVFADYELDMDAASLRTVTSAPECLCFSLSGLSKVCGLPQMKLGWIVATGPGWEGALSRLEWIADTFLSVSAPVQHAAAALLSIRHEVQEQIQTRTRSNLAYLRSAVAGSPLQVMRIEGGWYAILQVPRIRSEEAWALELLNRGALVQPGFYFDFESEAFLVLSLLTEPSVLQEGMRHILDAC
jgi:aspartate/methionine/tyrosine aminotransferase